MVAIGSNCSNNLDLALDLLKSGHRIDARSKLQRRQIEIEFLEDYGSVCCSLGNTKFIINVTSEAVQPSSDRPSEGILRFFCDLGGQGLGSKNDRTSTKERLLNRHLEKVFKSSRAIDTEGLCIVSSILVWSIRVDVRLVSDDGNLTTCAVLGTLAALIHFRRPDVTVVGDSDITIHDPESRNPVPLSIHHTPITSTYSLCTINGQPSFITDPSAIEESVELGSVTIAVNPQREICVLQKSGGVPCSIDTVKELCEISIQEARKSVDFIMSLCKEDLKKRSTKLVDR